MKVHVIVGEPTKIETLCGKRIPKALAEKPGKNQGVCLKCFNRLVKENARLDNAITVLVDSHREEQERLVHENRRLNREVKTLLEEADEVARAIRVVQTKLHEALS